MFNKLLNRDFVLLFQGQFVSQMGSLMYSVALIFWLKKNTESATIIGLFFMASMLPGIFLGPVGGAFVDKYSRKKILVLGDLINGTLMLAVAVVMLLFTHSVNLIFVLLFLTALSNGIVGAFFRPAMSAALPELVPRQSMNSANALISNSIHIASLIGLSIGGVLYKTLGMPVLMLINGAAYLLSAFSESFITIPQIKRDRSESRREIIEQLKIDVINGFLYLRQTPGLGGLFLVLTVWWFFSNSISVLLPFFVENVLNSELDWYGFLMASFSFGVLIGQSLAAIVKLAPKDKHKWITVALFIASLGLSALGFSPNTIIALVIMIALGTGGGFMYILVISTIQLSTPSEIRGRVLGLLNSITVGVAPIAMGLTGMVTDLLGQNITLMFLICGLCMVVISFYLSSSKEIRVILNYEEINLNFDRK